MSESTPGGREHDRSGFERFKGHGYAVDAITPKGWRRSIGKDVAQMATASAAMHFGSHHPEAPILGGFDSSRHRCIETGPARAAFEFRTGFEKGLVASHAQESTRALLMEEGAGSGSLRAVGSHHPVLLGREQTPPLLVRPHHGEGFRLHQAVLVFGSAPDIGANGASDIRLKTCHPDDLSVMALTVG